MDPVMCPSCGAENDPGQRFCDACAAPLGPACPSCGAANRPAARFCRECAEPITSDAGPASAAGDAPSTPVAERRVVSVLFADLVGSTAIADGRDPEETRDFLAGYFELATAVIDRYGGTVEKFIGDAVMAVWGAPTAHEDDAERAVRAALELVERVPSLAPGLTARGGVLTGIAAATIGATNQGIVAGDLVNTAARLQGAAEPGTVLVGETTARAARAAVEFEPAGDRAMKGKAAPVAAFRALGLVATRPGEYRDSPLQARFQGREAELALLVDLVEATARENRVRLVSVTGPAGVGKSRLAGELRRRLEATHGGGSAFWHSGRSPAYGDGISFWALGEMVRQRAGLRETDDEATTRRMIAEVVATWIPADDDRAAVEASLLALLGVESGIGAEELFSAWRRFFERVAASGTTVLAFEDVHWADPGTLDFIDHLVDWSRGAPILVIALARPELLERRPTWGARKRNFTSIYVEPLPDDGMRDLLADLVADLPAPAVEAIVGRAEGIPLYAVEIVRMLDAEGSLRHEGGAHVPTVDLATMAVPDTLAALIASRLDGLDPADRSLVQAAAVLGQSFTVAGLAAVSGIAATDLEPRLRRLVRREMFTLQADPASPGRGQYAFVQAMIREVAYNTLARRERSARHLVAAEFFASLGSDELAAALSGHYLAALANATPGAEADAVAGRARESLKAAADRAASLGGYAQAVTFLEAALSIAGDPAEDALLLERAGDAASLVARYEQVGAFLRRAIAIHRELGNRSGTARATGALGRALLGTYRTDAALELLGPAASELADLGDDPGLVALHGQLARAYFFHEQPDDAVAWADRTLPAAERLDLVDIVADTLVTRGSALANAGRTYEGIGTIEAGLHIAEANGLPRTMLRARANLVGYLPALIGPAGTLDAARRGLDDARRLGLRSWVIGLVLHATGAAAATGDWDWAMAEFEALLATDLDREDRATLLSGSIVIRARRGEDVEADMKTLESLVAGSKEPQVVARANEARAAVAMSQGRLGDARAAFRARAAAARLGAPLGYAAAARQALWSNDATAAAEDLAEFLEVGGHGPMIAARRMAILGGLDALDGRPGDALRAFNAARRASRELGATWDEALLGIDMALLLDAGLPDVQEATAASRAILERLGAGPMLARLDRIATEQAGGERRGAATGLATVTPNLSE